ncbi:hypothetical protein [Pandoraea terrigena]|uniref:Uncharacterized protein n=1 Tax=Pandoraea terrigena TaxID=2508292 RepID=A0A5E4YU14_9BURK|nr:hypothetical protein [Pandoraea terrigena]VVE51937.1 hypothetical protein PTE31013_04786 [Pandoraea terrigena]
MFIVASIRREARPARGTHTQQVTARAVRHAQVQLSVSAAGAIARATC